MNEKTASAAKNKKKLPFVSVVIALKNEKLSIGKCIESFLNQSYPADRYEILVYDGNSTDGSWEILKKIEERNSLVKLFCNRREVAAAGWNDGFKKARGKYVVMMGGHSYVAPDFISNNVKLLENSDAPCAGGSVTALGSDASSRAIALTFNHPFGVGDARYRYAKKQCLVETINYGMYRKSVVEAIGPINEKLKRGEDWEYNYRIVSRFGKMIYSPDVKVFYFARSDFKSLWRRQYDAGKFKWEIIRKYPKSLLLRHITPFLFALAVVGLPVLTVLGLNPKFLGAFWAIYLFTNLVFSFKIALSEEMVYLPYLVFGFFVMQFSYGLGFFVGFAKFLKSLIIGKKE